MRRLKLIGQVKRWCFQERHASTDQGPQTQFLQADPTTRFNSVSWSFGPVPAAVAGTVQRILVTQA